MTVVYLFSTVSVTTLVDLQFIWAQFFTKAAQKVLGYFENFYGSLLSSWDVFSQLICKGSGCGSVGRAVAFDTRDLRFESSHQQIFIKHLFTVNCVEKTKIKKKEDPLFDITCKSDLIQHHQNS